LSNNKTAKIFLKASLDSNFLNDLELGSKDSDTAAVTWMRIHKSMSEGSVKQFNRKRNKLKNLSLLKEPAESMDAYCSKARRVCIHLWQASQFQWILMLSIIKTLCLSTVEAFFIVFLPYCWAIDLALLESIFLSKEASSMFMTNEY
jgi:hypothetical protein